MRTTVTRYHDICAGHRVLNHEGKCKYLHGHGYRIHFTCEGDLDEIGRVIDFSVINDKLCMWIEQNWDHKTLLYSVDPLSNVVPDEHVWLAPFNPTAENMAEFLLRIIGPEVLLGTGVQLVSVRVDETPKCSAEVTIDDPRKLSRKRGLIYGQ